MLRTEHSQNPFVEIHPHVVSTKGSPIKICGAVHVADGQLITGLRDQRILCA